MDWYSVGYEIGYRSGQFIIFVLAAYFGFKQFKKKKEK